MRLGTLVYFKHEGVIKIGFVRKEIGTDDLLVISEDVSYNVKCWQIKVVPEEQKE